jgi:hypothetical protein
MDNGGPAFPQSGDQYADGGMLIRDYFAIHAPEPTVDQIETEAGRDRGVNPHGDLYKPRRRSRLEIIADLRYAYADALIAARGH